ncbi:hypothetical protein NDU88_007763 [Pleurodeles waltl]|uniref:Secreted protein n=1 Tax=Pleurodeles waltl TaxID=8319 RepID=A0AAV7QQQ2_PLEWA|nr:hypothetical protein NDU88_007763 [Pleurodeles waltl]
MAGQASHRLCVPVALLLSIRCRFQGGPAPRHPGLGPETPSPFSLLWCPLQSRGPVPPREGQLLHPRESTGLRSRSLLRVSAHWLVRLTARCWALTPAWVDRRPRLTPRALSEGLWGARRSQAALSVAGATSSASLVTAAILCSRPLDAQLVRPQSQGTACFAHPITGLGAPRTSSYVLVGAGIPPGIRMYRVGCYWREPHGETSSAICVWPLSPWQDEC